MTTLDILAARGPKDAVEPWVPYAFLHEEEAAADFTAAAANTVFLTNRECPFRCLMCDLWRNTTDEPVPVGAIPAQIEHALQRLPPARTLKLYNAGNFFDAAAIPPADHDAVAALCRPFETVVIENHPKLTDRRCVDFAGRLDARLEVALGLETVHPDVLPRLNKGMTLADFGRATDLLHGAGIATRAFVLLRPPWLDEAEGVEWAVRSVRHAQDHGVGLVAVIPTRAGNGIMERLQAAGDFSPPKLASLERVLDECLDRTRGRVTVDLWDVQRLFDCPACGPARAERLRRMNLTQTRLPPVPCGCLR